VFVFVNTHTQTLFQPMPLLYLLLYLDFERNVHFPKVKNRVGIYPNNLPSFYWDLVERAVAVLFCHVHPVEGRWGADGGGIFFAEKKGKCFSGN